MSNNRFFVDTFFIQALLNASDQYHDKALEIWPEVTEATEVWITEAVIVEIGNALSAVDREKATVFINGVYENPDPNLRLVSVDTALMRRALNLYKGRPDKSWGFTDCISFVVMRDNHLEQALTGDRHFTQAGFVAVLAADA